MKDLIIPEVIRKELMPTNNNPNSRDQTLNINLNNNIDRRVNNYTNTYNETNITNNNQSGGFFKFLFDIATLPFKIIYQLIMFTEKKFDIRETLRKEKIKVTRSKWVKKYITSTNDVYDMDEIY